MAKTKIDMDLDDPVWRIGADTTATLVNSSSNPMGRIDEDDDDDDDDEENDDDDDVEEEDIEDEVGVPMRVGQASGR